jgi:hypothetical protein
MPRKLAGLQMASIEFFRGIRTLRRCAYRSKSNSKLITISHLFPAGYAEAWPLKARNSRPEIRISDFATVPISKKSRKLFRSGRDMRSLLIASPGSSVIADRAR